MLFLTTYLFKLTNILGTPSYQLMAVVVVAIVLVTLPLVYPNLVGGIVNTFLLATVGAAAAVALYASIALAAHRWKSRLVVLVDYLVLLPRALPGLVAGLAFLWVFLFVPYLGMLRSSLVGLWLAYSVVWRSRW